MSQNYLLGHSFLTLLSEKLIGLLSQPKMCDGKRVGNTRNTKQVILSPGSVTLTFYLVFMDLAP